AFAGFPNAVPGDCGPFRWLSVPCSARALNWNQEHNRQCPTRAFGPGFPAVKSTVGQHFFRTAAASSLHFYDHRQQRCVVRAVLGDTHGGDDMVFTNGKLATVAEPEPSSALAHKARIRIGQ